MEVEFVGCEEGDAGPRPADDGREGVIDGYEKDGHGGDKAYFHNARGRTKEGEEGEDEAKGEGATVAHKYLGRRKIEDKEARNSPHKGKTGEGRSRITSEEEEKAKKEGREGRDTAREAIHAIEEIEGIRNADYPDEGYGIGEEAQFDAARAPRHKYSPKPKAYEHQG